MMLGLTLVVLLFLLLSLGGASMALEKIVNGARDTGTFASLVFWAAAAEFFIVFLATAFARELPV